MFAFGRRYLNRIQNAVAVGFFTFIGGCRLKGYLTYSADAYKRHSSKQISRAKNHVFVVDFCCMRPKGFGFQYKGLSIFPSSSQFWSWSKLPPDFFYDAICRNECKRGLALKHVKLWINPIRTVFLSHDFLEPCLLFGARE